MRTAHSALLTWLTAGLILTTVTVSLFLSYSESTGLNPRPSRSSKPLPEHSHTNQGLMVHVTVLPAETISVSLTHTPSAKVHQTTTEKPITQDYAVKPSSTKKSLVDRLPTSSAIMTDALPEHTPIPQIDTSVPPSSQLIPTSTKETRANGSVLYAKHLDTPPSIDGKLQDWDALSIHLTNPSYGAVNWQGPADQSARSTVAWDEKYLYIAAQVDDDVHVQRQHGVNIFKGDSLELVLDVDLEGDFNSSALSQDDYQVGLSPGDLKDTSVTPDAFMWYPQAKSRSLPEVVIGVDLYGDTGFQIEAAIPWPVFGIEPVQGMSFGFVLSSNDNDDPHTPKQHTMLSTISSRLLPDPTTWGTLVLDN